MSGASYKQYEGAVQMYSIFILYLVTSIRNRNRYYRWYIQGNTKQQFRIIRV